MKIKKNVNIYLNKESRAHNTKDTKGTALFILFVSQCCEKKHDITLIINNVRNYNLLIKTRVVNKRTNLGNMYLENTNINSAIIANANVT